MKGALAAAVVFVLAAGMAAEEPRSQFMTASDGVRIHYLELGRDGSPVILIHGYTANAEGKWFKSGIAQALASKHRVIAIDARGHGKSDKPHDPAKYGPRMATDVIELMDHLKIPRAHIHGYSMGGSILTQILARHPNRVITAIYGGSGPAETDPAWQARVPKDPEPPAANDPNAPRGEAWSSYPGYDRVALDAVQKYPWQPGDRDIDLTKVTVPVLAIVGSFDRPNARTHRLKREVKNAQVVVLPGETHGSAHLNPAYTAALVRFIDAPVSSPDRARVDSGSLTGESVNGVRVYKGVPFAQPPVGDLRWAPPQPVTWTGDRDATRFQPACPQPINADGRPNGGGVSGATAEDCLYLNLWAPSAASNAPVMLWLYGGAGYLGAGHLAAYDGSSFARQGVIVVTINYRLGALGSFAHPALTKAARPGDGLANYALMDAIAGLQWVKRNIRAFGGDATNVTLFGQSAGGSMVSRLLSSPPAKGLFHKAIIHSGTNLEPGISLEAGEKWGIEAATALGVPGANATLAELRAVPAQKLVDTTSVRPGARGVNDGRIKTVSTRDGFANGATFDVPLIAGSNNGEGGADRAHTIINLAASGASAFQYYFSYVPEPRRAAQPNGAPHSAELRYAFASLADTASAKDREVAAGMNSCWAAFAKSPVTARSLTCANGFVWQARTPEIAVFGEAPSLARASAVLPSSPTPRQGAIQR